MKNAATSTCIRMHKHSENYQSVNRVENEKNVLNQIIKMSSKTIIEGIIHHVKYSFSFVVVVRILIFNYDSAQNIAVEFGRIREVSHRSSAEIRSVYASFTTNYVRVILILWMQIKMYTQIIIKQHHTPFTCVTKNTKKK